MPPIAKPLIAFLAFLGWLLLKDYVSDWYDRLES